MERSVRKLLLPFLVIGLLGGIVGFLAGLHFDSRGNHAGLDKGKPRTAKKDSFRSHESSGPADDLERILADRTSVSSRNRKFSEYLDRRLLDGQSSALLKELKALPGSPDRTAALLQLAVTPPSDLTMSEWSDVLLAGLEGVERSSVSSALAQTWAETDARGAFDRALKEADAGYRGALLAESMVRLAREDAPAAASRLIQSRSNLGGDFAAGVSRLCEVWAESHPQAAEKWVADHSADWMPYERDEANSMIVTTMALEHPEEAVQRLSIISDPERRDLAFREIFTEWAESDPAGAAAALPARRPGHDVELAAEVALTWGVYDYSSTVRWVKNTPAIPDELRDSVLKRLEDAHGGRATDAAASE
jgi:hypothetical protein